MNNLKKGGGGKLQPFVPSGNGDKSGEYTSTTHNALDKYNCNIKIVPGKHNYLNSKLVGRVEEHFVIWEQRKIPVTLNPNSVAIRVVNCYVVTERYYNEKGEPYLDIDYTCHGTPVNHPVVPHIHKWVKDENGHYTRKKWEAFI